MTPPPTMEGEHAGVLGVDCIDETIGQPCGECHIPKFQIMSPTKTQKRNSRRNIADRRKKFAAVQAINEATMAINVALLFDDVLGMLRVILMMLMVVSTLSWKPTKGDDEAKPGDDPGLGHGVPIRGPAYTPRNRQVPTVAQDAACVRCLPGASRRRAKGAQTLRGRQTRRPTTRLPQRQRTWHSRMPHRQTWEATELAMTPRGPGGSPVATPLLMSQAGWRNP